jgi:hypothetical protein
VKFYNEMRAWWAGKLGARGRTVSRFAGWHLGRSMLRPYEPEKSTGRTGRQPERARERITERRGMAGARKDLSGGAKFLLHLTFRSGYTEAFPAVE